MRYTEEQKRGHYRGIYDILWKDFRMNVKDMADLLGLAKNTVRERLNEALDKGYLIYPQIRKRSYFGEYSYIVQVKNPLETYIELKGNKDIIYHAVMGDCLWIISKEFHAVFEYHWSKDL